MQAEIVSIGTELLLGEIVDTNSAHIARALRDIGMDVYYMTTVGDNEQRTADALRTALKRSDVVIATGGLGPTVDDITRQAVAAATGHPLEFKQELLDQIAERFRRFGAQMSENNHQQAYVPQDAIAIENPVGTAPVFIVDDSDTGGGIVIVLPGVPREMKHLLESEIIPWLQQRLGLKSTIKARIIRTAGIGESTIDNMIADLMKLTNPTVGLAAHPGQTDIRITAKAESEKKADALIAPVEAQLRELLGEFIYGTGQQLLEEAVIRLCVDSDVSLATCEAGADGKLASRLNRAADGNAIFVEGLTFEEDGTLADELGIDGGLPVTEFVEAAALACREKFGVKMGLAVVVRPMIEGEDDGQGGTALAVATGSGVHSHYYAFDHERIDSPVWVTTHALAMARNAILKGRA